MGWKEIFEEIFCECEKENINDENLIEICWEIIFFQSISNENNIIINNENLSKKLKLKIRNEYEKNPALKNNDLERKFLHKLSFTNELNIEEYDMYEYYFAFINDVIEVFFEYFFNQIEENLKNINYYLIVILCLNYMTLNGQDISSYIFENDESNISVFFANFNDVLLNLNNEKFNRKTFNPIEAFVFIDFLCVLIQNGIEQSQLYSIIGPLIANENIIRDCRKYFPSIKIEKKDCNDVMFYIFQNVISKTFPNNGEIVEHNFFFLLSFLQSCGDICSQPLGGFLSLMILNEDFGIKFLNEKPLPILGYLLDLANELEYEQSSSLIHNVVFSIHSSISSHIKRQCEALNLQYPDWIDVLANVHSSDLPDEKFILSNTVRLVPCPKVLVKYTSISDLIIRNVYLFKLEMAFGVINHLRDVVQEETKVNAEDKKFLFDLIPGNNDLKFYGKVDDGKIDIAYLIKATNDGEIQLFKGLCLKEYNMQNSIIDGKTVTIIDFDIEKDIVHKETIDSKNEIYTHILFLSPLFLPTFKLYEFLQNKLYDLIQNTWPEWFKQLILGMKSKKQCQLISSAIPGIPPNVIRIREVTPDSISLFKFFQEYLPTSKLSFEAGKIDQYISFQTHRIMGEMVETSLQFPEAKNARYLLSEGQLSAFLHSILCFFTCIIGPPGCGKTFTAIRILLQFLSFGLNNMIICAHSNRAVDQIIDELMSNLKEDNQVIFRLGSSTTSILSHKVSFLGKIESFVEKINVEILRINDFFANSSEFDEFECDNHLNSVNWLNFMQRKFFVNNIENRISKIKSEFEQDRFEFCERHNIKQAILNETYESFENIDNILKLLKLPNNKLRSHFLSNAKFIICTISGGLLNYSLLNKIIPSVLFVEEAGKVLESELLPLISLKPNRIILMGDDRQLEPVILSKIVAKSSMSQSLFRRLQIIGVPVIKLNNQRRCHQDIQSLWEDVYKFSISNDPITNRESIISSVTKNLDKRVKWNNVEYRGSKKRETNEAEASAIKTFIESHIIDKIKENPQTIAILTPYKNQKDYLEKIIFKSQKIQSIQHLNCINIATTDAFQGLEADIVLISMVAKNPTLHLCNTRRITVLLSRARRDLIIFGNYTTFCRKPVWKDIVRKMVMLNQGIHIEKKNKDVKSGNNIQAGSNNVIKNSKKDKKKQIRFDADLDEVLEVINSIDDL
eukprot:TRINITY_DN7156_c0_g1_i1.p1 TRINITY_DN7156_c0_g1~~TRINITY_DN7156_c0_g1_i1.p1  ORF type:complete len:1198 (+),score=324.69 TRINITY_DN7156_c0_g1_i1:30-3596(+)